MCYVVTEVGKVASPLLVPLHVGDMLTEAIISTFAGVWWLLWVLHPEIRKETSFLLSPSMYPLFYSLFDLGHRFDQNITGGQSKTRYN